MRAIGSVIAEEAVFSQIYDEILKTKHMIDGHVEHLTKVFGSRFQSAYKAIEEGRVRKYLFHPSGRIVWIVAGKEGEYQVLPIVNFCSCNDFYFRVISHEAFLCYHLIAQKLAEALDKYVLVERADEAYEALMEGWRRIRVEERRLPMGEVENVRRVAEAILSEAGELSVSQLLDEVKKTGFNLLTTRHLANILVADKGKRFKCREGVWTLVRRSVATG